VINDASRHPRWRRVSQGIVVLGVVLAGAACSSSASDSGSGGGGVSGATLTAAKNAVSQHISLPAKIQETQSFTPKPDKLIFNVSCNLAIVGCGEISTEIGNAVKAIGDRFQRCNAGATPSQAQGCFTNAVNAKASVIVDNDVPRVGSGNGFAQAQAAHIPVAGAFTGNPLKTIDEPTQAAEDAPTVEAQLLADYVISKSKGKADVLYIGENQDNDGVLRGKSFLAEMAKCPTCKVKTIQVNQNTQTTSGPPQINAALEANPGTDWIIGNQDTVAALAVQVVGSLGRTGHVSIGGMDADPQNIQYIKQGKQTVDVTVGQGEVAYAAVYAAIRIASGLSVPLATPVNIWLIDGSNASQIPSSGVFFGPANYQKQFLALMGK
jgi:ABC-type sugar transport system substrate-binding protein